MNSNQTTNLVNLSDIKKVIKMNGVGGTLIGRSAMRVMGINRMNSHYNHISKFYGSDFTRAVIESYNISLDINEEEIENIPKTGPFIIVSNHPFGAWDGITLYDTISRVRPDFKILTNFLLSYIPNLKDYFLSVNPFTDRKSLSSSITGIKRAHTILQEGGCLGIFPAGEVATYYRGVGHCEDKDWNQSIMKLVMNAGVPVVPVYFDGENSKIFHRLGRIHPMLRTINLINEMNKREGKRVTMKIGKPIGISELAKYGDTASLSAYLKSRTYALEANTDANKPIITKPVSEKPLPPEPDYVLLQKEIDELKRGSSLLFTVSKYECLLADYDAIPALMQEIGRKREESFRQVGEGTGKSIDVDKFDNYYKHLILWDSEASRLVGAYRLGIGKEIFEKYGIDGFYTNTLFKFSDKMVERLPYSIELGRSFLSVEYKKEALPLMLLIKGLLYTVTRYDSCKFLFGPASISSWYPMFYRSSLVYSLNKLSSSDYVGEITPRTPFRFDFLRSNPEVLFAGKCDNIDYLDKYIQRLSNGVYRIPTLIKKYVKLNAELLAFNVDKDFNYCVDGMVLLDLDKVPLEEVTSLTKGSENPEELLKRFRK